jgi:hypothetical protein
MAFESGSLDFNAPRKINKEDNELKGGLLVGTEIGAIRY